MYPCAEWAITHFASGVGFARSISVRNGTPSQSLSSSVQPVTQCMSACTGVVPSARSSSQVSVNGCSTRPLTCRSQFTPSKAGIGP